MSRTRYWLATLTQSSSSAAALLALVGVNTLFNIIANAAFKVSAFSPNWRGFLIWQVVGNIAGLITVLTLTALLRLIPLHVAFTVTTGLAVLGVQIAAASVLFHEPVSRMQWMGAMLVVLGIALVSQR